MSSLESIQNSNDRLWPVNKSKISKGSYHQPVAKGEDLIAIGNSESVARSWASDGGREKSVIGTDGRVQVGNTLITPWNKICALRITSRSGVQLGVGTGWLAGPQTVITAGHIVHNLEAFAGWAPRIEVAPGRNGFGMAPFGVIPSTVFSSVPQWVSGQRKDFDIGCIHLPKSFPTEVGWFSYGTVADEILLGHVVNVSGYPQDLGGGAFQFHHKDRIRAVENRRIFYEVDTNRGQSGAPVFIQLQVDQPPIVVGIHAYGSVAASHLPFEVNSSPRILSDVFELINGWVASDMGWGEPIEP